MPIADVGTSGSPGIGYDVDEEYVRAQTVRALTLRKHHPLPSINTGMCTRRQRIFLRPSVLRWLREEEKLSKTAQPEDGDDRAEQAS